MGSAALRPSVAVGRLLRDERKRRGLTLRAVSEAMTKRGERIPTSTLARIEQGKLDPGVRRLHFLMEFYEVSPELVADLVQLERVTVNVPEGKTLEELHEEGLRLWQNGDVSQGLAHLLAVRDHDARDDATRKLRQTVILDLASAAHDLGKGRLMRRVVDELLCEPPVRSLVPGVLLLAARLWRERGSTETALGLMHEAADCIDPGDHARLARVLYERAEVLLSAGRLSDADAAAESAAAHRRALGDRAGELRAKDLVKRVRAAGLDQHAPRREEVPSIS